MRKLSLLSLIGLVLVSMTSVEVEAARNCRRDNSCVNNTSRNNNGNSRADRDRNRNRNSNGNSRADRDRNRNSNGNGNSRADRDRNRNSGTTVNRDRNRNTGTTVSRNRNRNRNNGTTVNRDRNRNSGTTVNRDRNRNNTRTDRDRRRYRDSRRTNAHRSYRHRPNWNRRNYVYARNTHRPQRYDRSHHRRWNTNRSYHRSVPYRDIYWNRWLRVRVTWNNGYNWNNNYPWYTYNGYGHRYSRVDYCNYELVDGYNNSVERTYYNYTCNTGYDMCADLRDNLNSYERGYRYFCSEKLEGTHTDYNYNYNDDFYSDVASYDDDGYDDGYGYDDYSDWDSDFDSNW